MVKSFRSSQSKKSKKYSSPLMEDPEAAVPHTASRLAKDEKRAAQRHARDEQEHSKDEEHRAAAKAAKRKREKARETKAKQDVKDAHWDRCERFQVLLVKMVHVLDSLIGLTFVIYGGLIATQYKEPALAAVITSLVYGAVLLLASVMGVVGFYSPRCGRVGLSLSAWIASLVAFFYLFVVVLDFSPKETDKFFDYLTVHMDVLYLNDEEISVLRDIKPFFHFVLAGLTAIQVCRFLLLRHLRVKLLAYDSATERMSGAHLEHVKCKNAKSKSTKSSRGNSSGGGSKRHGSDRSALTEPLLDEEAGGSNGEEDD